MLLRELFDKPVEFNARGVDSYRFTVNGINYKFDYDIKHNGLALFISFCEMRKGNCLYDVTNSGNSVVVFSTVLEILKKLMTENNTRVLSFGADVGNRQKLYMRMVKKILPDWKILIHTGADGNKFYTLFSSSMSFEELVKLCEAQLTTGRLYIPMEFFSYELCKLLLDKKAGFISSIPTPDQKKDVGWNKVYKALCIEAVSKDGFDVYHIPKKYRDYDICLAAVNQANELLNYDFMPSGMVEKVRAAIGEDR